MQRYTDSTYGDAFADVYDDWYGGVSDVDATVRLVERLAAAAGATSVLELGAGTGRLAVPLAETGLHVTAVDASTAMLDRLRARDPDRRVTIVTGDMVDELPDGPFGVVLVAYNTLFNLTSEGRQQACCAAAAARLAPGGSFVVEAFVPEEPPRHGSQIDVRSMTADEVVLNISVHDGDDQRVEGHVVHLAQGRPVRLRPWAIRYLSPGQLDAVVAATGLRLTDRWEDFTGRPFGANSSRHVSVYRRSSPLAGQMDA